MNDIDFLFISIKHKWNVKDEIQHQEIETNSARQVILRYFMNL